MSAQTETSVILNPITLINHRESILKVDEQSLLLNYRDGTIIIEVGCGCHNLPNEIISRTNPPTTIMTDIIINHFFLNIELYSSDHPALVSMEIAC